MRYVMVVFLVVCLYWTCLAPANAERLESTLKSQVGYADTIAVGTVTHLNTVATAPDTQRVQATIAVERVLKGEKRATLTGWYQMTGKSATGAARAEENFVPSLSEQQHGVFFLVRAQGGYSLPWGAASVRPISAIDAVAAMVTNFPIAVTLVPFAECYFGQPTKVTVKIRNTTKAPMQVVSLVLEGFDLSPRLAPRLTFVSATGSRDGAQPMLPPGQETTVELTMTLGKSSDWNLLPTDSYFLTPSLVRACVRIDSMPGPRDATPRDVEFLTTSPWQPVMTGYAPPPQIP